MHSYNSSFHLGFLGLNKLNDFTVSVADYLGFTASLAIVSTCSLVLLCWIGSSSIIFKAVTHLAAVSIA